MFWRQLLCYWLFFGLDECSFCRLVSISIHIDSLDLVFHITTSSVNVLRLIFDQISIGVNGNRLSIFLIEIALKRIRVLGIVSLVLLHEYLMGLMFVFEVGFGVKGGLVVDGLVFVSMSGGQVKIFIIDSWRVFETAVVVAHVDWSVSFTVVVVIMVI